MKSKLEKLTAKEIEAITSKTKRNKNVPLVIASRCREMKIYPKGIDNFSRKRRVQSAAKDLNAIVYAYAMRSFAALWTRSCRKTILVSRFARIIGISRQELVTTKSIFQTYSRREMA